MSNRANGIYCYCSCVSLSFLVVVILIIVISAAVIAIIGIASIVMVNAAIKVKCCFYRCCF